MRALLVTANPGKILDLAAAYLNEVVHTQTTKVSVVKGLPEFIPAADAAIDMFLLNQEIKKTSSRIVLAQDTLWTDVARARLSLADGEMWDRTFKAHNLIVMEGLLKADQSSWDMIFYRPIQDDELDEQLGKLYLEHRDALLPDLGPFIKLPDDEDQAMDELVSEVTSYLGLDDDGE